MAACLSRLAGQMFLLVVILYVLKRFDSPALAGWVSFAAIAPGLLISPLAGALLDRLGSAKAIIVDMVTSAVLLCVLVAAGRMDAVSAPFLLALVTLYSLTSPLAAAGIRTLIPRMVPANALDRANALDTSSFAIIEVLGPALAGLLFGFAGAHAALLVIAMTYVLASLSLVPSARRQGVRRPDRSAPLLREALSGLSYVVRHRTLRGLALSYSLYQMSFGVLLVAVPVTVVGELGGGAQAGFAVGALWALAGLAGGFGALYAGHVGAIRRERRFIMVGTAITAVAIYPVAAMGLVGLTLGLALAGFLAGPVDVGVLTLRQRRTDPAWLGRVLAVSMSLNMSGLPLGSALGGLVATRSPAAAFAIAAVTSALAALAAYLVVPARCETAADEAHS